MPTSVSGLVRWSRRIMRRAFSVCITRLPPRVARSTSPLESKSICSRRYPQRWTPNPTWVHFAEIWWPSGCSLLCAVMSSRRIASLGAAAALAAAVLAAGQLASGHPLASARRCPVFPKSNQWNLPVDKLPLAGNSGAMVRSIGIDRPVHADFGSGNYNGGPIGIPEITGSGRAHTTRVSFDYSDESDKGPYPIPKNVPIEGGRNASGDRHAIIVERSRCRLYELYALQPTSGGGWHAGSGAIWNLRSNPLRPRSWTL